MPFLSGDDFMRLISVVDVMLDPINFSGGNTSFDGFATGTPIVNRAGNFMRSRVTYAMYRQMDITGGIADSADDYAKKVVELGRVSSLRDDMRSQILAAGDRLYDRREPVLEMADVLEAASRAS